MTFETLIIDEASQTTEPESWIAIGKAERIILAGDPVQLPHDGKDAAGAKPFTKDLDGHLVGKNFPLIY